MGKRLSLLVFLLTGVVSCAGSRPPGEPLLPPPTAETAAAPDTLPAAPAPLPAPTITPATPRWPGRLDQPVDPEPVGLLPPTAPTPTPNPLAPYTIPALAARTFGESDILVREVVATNLPFHRYVIEYRSDGITVTGLMNVPHGEGPFPVAIVLHGYIPPEVYERGQDSAAAANYLAQHGYAAIMPDYRGYMRAAGGPNPLRIPYAIDVLNLIESLDTLNVLDETRVGVVGHSMGGGIATYVMVLSERVSAVVLYGSMSADQAANWEYISRRWAPYWMTFTAQLYGSPETNPEGYTQVSPIHYLERVRMPVQIHHGTADDQVPLEWSVDLAARLRAAGAPVTLYTYQDAGHTFSGADLRLFHERVLALFERHVRGAAP